tara:strand:+ start:30 stop:584 length:555 start_codon:yes stop_codon:yes gene_type:complete
MLLLLLLKCVDDPEKNAGDGECDLYLSCHRPDSVSGGTAIVSCRYAQLVPTASGNRIEDAMIWPYSAPTPPVHRPLVLQHQQLAADPKFTHPGFWWAFIGSCSRGTGVAMYDYADHPDVLMRIQPPIFCCIKSLDEPPEVQTGDLDRFRLRFGNKSVTQLKAEPRSRKKWTLWCSNSMCRMFTN